MRPENFAGALSESQPGFRGVKAGVCYAHQLVGELPVEPHDVFMDYVVTND